MREISMMSAVILVFTLVGCSEQSISSPGVGPSGPSLPAATRSTLVPGEVETVVSLRPLIDMPEGIAIDRSGNIFIGNRRLTSNRPNADLRLCEVLRISPDHTVSVLATLDQGARNGPTSGTTGLAVGPRGEVFAALVSFHPATHGVWRIQRDGVAKHLAGSQEILLPNALVFDRAGNLY